jgi:hypothetical protein
MRSKSTKVFRFVMFSALLVLELSLVVGFYVLPQFQARNASAMHLGMEMPLQDSLAMRMAAIAYLGLLVAGNLGLMTMVWRTFKELKRPSR